jgi:hypothetical protein
VKLGAWIQRTRDFTAIRSTSVIEASPSRSGDRIGGESSWGDGAGCTPVEFPQDGCPPRRCTPHPHRVGTGMIIRITEPEAMPTTSRPPEGIRFQQCGVWREGE